MDRLEIRPDSIYRVTALREAFGWSEADWLRLIQEFKLIVFKDPINETLWIEGRWIIKILQPIDLLGSN